MNLLLTGNSFILAGRSKYFRTNLLVRQLDRGIGQSIELASKYAQAMKNVNTGNRLGIS